MARVNAGVIRQLRANIIGSVLRWVIPSSPSQATTSACSKPIKGLSTWIKLSSTSSRVLASARVATPPSKVWDSCRYLASRSRQRTRSTKVVCNLSPRASSSLLPIILLPALLCSADSRGQENHARYHQIAVGQLAIGQPPLLAEGKGGNKRDLAEASLALLDKLAQHIT